MKNKYDLIVVGGGFGGVASAISAARGGADVLLIEKFNCFGGAASYALVAPFMYYWTENPETDEREYLCGGLFREIVEEMNKIIDIKLPDDEPTIELFDEELLKLVLNRMVKEAGVKVLFNATVTEAEVSDGVMTGVRVFGKGTSNMFYADYFIDATGDAELSVMAGCEYQLGRTKDNLCQPMTLCFRLCGVDKEKFFESKQEINHLYRKLQKEGKIKNPRENVLTFDNPNEGVIHFNTTRIVMKNPTDLFDLTDAEMEAREQVFEMLYFLRENFEAFKKARVLSTALQIGIRESRKIVGEYTITQQDLLDICRFDDAIATANYAIDIHNPEGKGTHCRFFEKGEWYEIPYRCLIPKAMKNMLVVGKCISATHEAHSSYRIMPYCAELGEAAGNAISLLIKAKADVRDVDIKKLQEILRNNGSKI